jgi:phosphotriesterase-related protein
MHEHILNDCQCWWHQPKEKSRHRLACEPVNPGILGELRMDHFVNLDNLSLDDERLAIAELALAVDEGCRTVVDPTCRGIGRNPEALVRIARATGLNIIMGGGYYLEASHPPRLATMTADDIAAEVERDATEGVNPTGVRIGVIGEIGVSADFTPAEQKSLRGAARAAHITGLPLTVHVPGWLRHGGPVLDIIEEEGAAPCRTVLCHMNPSHSDPAYQEALAARSAFIGYDMIGMDFWYADLGVQCPSDEENARAIAGLVGRGFVANLLLSQDVFLKMMLIRNGGFGYAYLQRHFLRRLLRHGVSSSAIRTMMIANPCRLFGG